MIMNHNEYYVDKKNGNCTREIKMRITIANEAFNRKISLLTCKLNIEIRKKLVRCYVWSIFYMAQRPGHYENWSGNIWRALKCGVGGEWRR